MQRSHPTSIQARQRDYARKKRRALNPDGAQWRAIRKAQLERYPLCAHCGEPANEADHIEGDTSKNIVGVDLQSLCKPCHSSKTARDEYERRTGKRMPLLGCDADGIPIDPAHHWNVELREKSRAAVAAQTERSPFIYR